MCMTLALTAPGIGLAAADTRYSFERHGTHDFGQRIRRVDGGWAAATGNVAVVLLALREVESLGLSDWAAVQKVVPEVHTFCEAHSRTGKVADSMVLAVRESAGGFSVHGVLSSDGLTFDRSHSNGGNFGCFIAWPVGIDLPRAQRINPGWYRRFATSGGVPELLRNVARAFEYGRTNGRRMSEEVEIGLSVMEDGSPTAYHLRKPTAWIIAAGDREIWAALNPPPVLPPFREIESEKLVFPPMEIAV